MRIYPLRIAVVGSFLVGLLLAWGMAGCSLRPVEQWSGRVCFDLYIVPDKGRLPPACVALDAEACAIGSTVWMVGERSVGDYTYLNECFLGHEVRHVLSRNWPERFEDPDRAGKAMSNAGQGIRDRIADMSDYGGR